MTSSDALNSQVFKLRDDKGLDIINQVSRQLNNSIGSGNGLVSYLNDISKTNYILYILLAIVITLIWSRLKVSMTTVIGICLAIFLLFIYNETQRNTASDVNRDLMIELETLDTLTGQKHIYIYLEPDIIRFWADNVDFREYAKDAFDRSLKLADLFMNLYYDIETGTNRCSADIDVMHDLQRRVMNTWNEITFNLPNSGLVREKHESSLDKLQIILIKLLREAKNHCKSRTADAILEADIDLPITNSQLTNDTDQYLMY